MNFCSYSGKKEIKEEKEQCEWCGNELGKEAKCKQCNRIRCKGCKE